MPLKPFSINWFLCKIIKFIQLLLIILINLSLLNDCYVGIIMCNAATVPTTTSKTLPSSLEMASDQHAEVAFKRVAAATIYTTNGINNLTRQHEGDIFNANDMAICNDDTCVGLSSGTAGLFKSDTKEIDVGNKLKSKKDECRCQCFKHLKTFREDLNICVDDINECALAPFISGSSSEKIPFVILPLRGQIIHPSKEISFHGVKAPICAVAGSQYLTTTGWSELRNSIDTDVPFRLFGDEGRTYLQWLGESDLRYKMQGRLILVHLMCRDMAAPSSIEDMPGLSEENGKLTNSGLMHNQNMFSPCVAFRVIGHPIKHISNVTEVSFQSETHANTSQPIDGLTTKEYVAIGICSVLLGLIYVASVFLYLHVKKRKSRNASLNAAASPSTIATVKNDQVTFTASFRGGGGSTSFGIQNRSDLMGGGSVGGGGSFRGNTSAAGYSTMTNGLSGEELGIVKNNPLLKHYPNLNDNSGFISDMSNSNSEDEHTLNAEIIKNLSAIVHTTDANGIPLGRNFGYDNTPSPTQETECLPEENVSIVEDMSSEDKLENMKAIVNGTIRRKLYFNPAYFEPQLLLSPPPAAIEFLTKIREVITIAKYKMATKRFQPSLIMIPEEHAIQALNKSLIANSRPSSVTTGSHKDNSRKMLNCAGCPGCTATDDKSKLNCSDTANANCKNCGDKRNSIRKWLEDVSTHEIDRLIDGDTNEHNILEKEAGNDVSACVSPKLQKKSSTDTCSNSSGSSDTIKANNCNNKLSTPKRKAPPLPKTDPPKIISHFLKQDIPKPSILANTANIVNKSDSQLNDQKSSLYHKNSIQSLNETNKVYTKTEIYNQLSRNGVGSELYNNPQFQLSQSPKPFHRTKQSNSISKATNGKISTTKNSFEVLDQFSNPQKNRHYEAMQNLRQMPDMIYEAMAKDLTKSQHHLKNHYGHINVPAPDYDDSSSYRRSLDSSDDQPYIHLPPPDYNNTLGRSKPHYQPDSPIYTRKSPHFLIVDYETDSLERAASKKSSRNNSVTPPSTNTSDLSSQPSPSLSSALPLEEEVEVRNTVYDRVEGYRKDIGDFLDGRRGLNNREMAYLNGRNSMKLTTPIERRIKYNTPFQGSMTIEVEHNPTDCDASTDSEQFEPDTLDRKPKRLNNQIKSSKEWSDHMIRSANFLNNQQNCSYGSLQNMTSLPDMQTMSNCQSQFVLRSNGSFKSNCSLNENGIGGNFNDPNLAHLQRNFSSLREIYEAKTQKNQPISFPITKSVDSVLDKGRLLTLEARHSKRQRKTKYDTTNTLKKPMPPDVIPFEQTYDSPAALSAEAARLKGLVMQKNLMGWNADEDMNQEYNDHDTCDTASQNSGSTEITGVSDTQINSEFESDKQTSTIRTQATNGGSLISNNDSYVANNKLSKFHINNSIKMKNDKVLYDRIEQRPIEILENFMNLGDIRNKDFIDSENPKISAETTTEKLSATSLLSPNDDQNEIKSIRSLNSNHTIDVTGDDTNSTLCNSTTSLIHDLTSSDMRPFDAHQSRLMMIPTKVYRVDCSNTTTNGMQIALGLKDRVKKSKDLKNAWRKFVSKFHTKSSTEKPDLDCLEKSSVMSDGDEGISSMNDDNATVSDNTNKYSSRNISRTPSQASDCTAFRQLPTGRAATGGDDGGYMSADSSEYRIQNKKLYERFNFKSTRTAVATGGGGDGSSSSSTLGGVSDYNLQKNINRMQEIKETAAEMERNSPKLPDRNVLSLSGGTGQPHMINLKNGGLDKSIEPIDINVYSSDDERYSSGMLSESGEDGDDGNLDESGAESVETHSVFFKNVRNQEKTNV